MLALLGMGTGDSPQFTAINVGAASDTTIARSGAGDITVEGNAVYRAGGTDVPVADGGTGASTLTDGGILLGSGTGAITATAVLADSEMIVGDGTTDPVLESGATLRTSIGVDAAGTDNSTNVTLAGSPDYLTLSGQEITRGAIVLTTDVSGTLPVANGGSGATSLTDGGILLGSGTGAVTAMSVLSDGQMIVGDGTTDPVAESGATLRTSIGVDAAGTDNSTNVTLAGTPDYITISGQEITRGAIVLTTDVSGTLPVANGGSGATSLTDGGLLLGSGTGAITAMAVLANGEMIVGDGTTDPVAESGATLRTSIGVGTGDSPTFTDLTLSGDDLTMATNTSGAALIADGTNFNPVVISGDISINTSGVAAIGSAVIVEADIADNAVTLAKMAGGTDGNIISFDTSGNPVAVATGTDGQVLTSSGAGTVCAFEDAAGGGGGAWNLLETQNPSNAATVDMVTTIDSTYSRYYIEITDVVPATDGVQFMARISDDGGSTWKEGATDYEYHTTQWHSASDAAIVTRSTGDSAFRLTTDTTNADMGSDGGKGGTFTVTLSNPANTALQQLVMWQGQWDTPAGSTTANSFGGGNYSTAEAIDGIQFLMSSGNVESGKFSLYGLSM
jgi:hypothetical protein